MEIYKNIEMEENEMKRKKIFLKQWKDNKGMGTVEMILIIVEKPNAKHRYVLCGN